MPRLAYTEAALRRLNELPAEPELLWAVWRELEAVADAPEDTTEPGAPPAARPDRRVRRFWVGHPGGLWGFSATFAVEHDAVVLTALASNPNAGSYPPR